MELKSLMAVLPPPEKPREVSDDWEAVEKELGTPLPEDYKEFIRVYGSGSIDKFLVVFNPFSANEFVNLLDGGLSHLGAFATIAAQFPQYFPQPIFPSPGGILTFARTDNGDALYWVTSGPPEQWTVTVFESRGDEHFDFDGSMTEFLVALLTRSIQCSVFPEDFPSEEVAFRPLGEPRREKN
jgi:hypothetical protein